MDYSIVLVLFLSAFFFAISALFFGMAFYNRRKGKRVFVVTMDGWVQDVFLSKAAHTSYVSVTVLNLDHDELGYGDGSETAVAASLYGNPEYVMMEADTWTM